MKKRELAAAVANHVEVDPRTAGKVIDGTIDVILATVAKGEDVALTGFAKFAKQKRAARTARNPATGAPVKVKAKTVAKITPLKGFKDVVLGMTPAPKLAKAAPAKKAAASRATATTTTTTKAAAKTTAAKAPAAAKKTTARKTTAAATATPARRAAAKK